MAAGGKVPAVSARPETITARQLFRPLPEDARQRDDRGQLAQDGEDAPEPGGREPRREVPHPITHGAQPPGVRRAAAEEGCGAGHPQERNRHAPGPAGTGATHGELVKGVFPGRGLRFPKEEETEPFRTFAEIEAIIAAEKPDEARRDCPVARPST